MPGDQKILEESSSGFPYQRVAITITALAVLTFLTLSIINLEPKEQADPEWTFYLFMAANFLILGAAVSFIFPNTYRVKLMNDVIEISSKRKSQEISLTKIKDIKPTTIWIANWLLKAHEFYTIEFSEMTDFGKTVYFKTTGRSILESDQNFGERLRSEWLRKKFPKTSKVIYKRK